MSEELKAKIKKESKDVNSSDMFIGYNEHGEKQIFYKLLEFDSNETGKHYLAYTDNTTDEKGTLKAYGAVVNKEGEYMKLTAIETEKEWKVIETALNVLQSELNKNDEEE